MDAGWALSGIRARAGVHLNPRNECKTEQREATMTCCRSITGAVPEAGLVPYNRAVSGHQ